MSEKLVALRNKVKKDRADAYRAALELVDRSDIDPQASTELEFALDRVEQMDRRLKRLPKIDRVVEPDLYRRSGEFSYFRDLAEVASHGSAQFAALERLQRHNEYTKYRRASRSVVQAAEAQARGVIIPEQRALSLTAGQGLEYSPPVFLLDQLASIARSASPVLRSIRSTPLPEGCSSIYVPRVTSAGGVVVEEFEDVDTATTWQGTDQILVPIATFAGQVPMSQQLWERGGRLDQYLTQDFAEAASASFEQQIIAGTGSGGQVLGLLNLPTSTVDGVPGASVVTFTSATPLPTGVIAAIGQGFAAVGNARLRAPSTAIMTPERYAWLTATPDGSGNESTQRPGTGLVPSNADTGEYGPIAGLPALLSGEVPQNLGAEANQDTVLVVRTADFLWLPSDPVFECYIDTEGAASEMSIYASWHCYGAFVSARYPSAVASVQGTGMNRAGLMWS